MATITLASAGYSATLLLQARLIALTPDELSGHALGLHSSGMLALQGVGAALAGTIAQQTSPAAATAVMAAASVAVTVVLAPGLRTGRPAAFRDWDTPSAMTLQPPGYRPVQTLLGVVAEAAGGLTRG